MGNNQEVEIMTSEDGSHTLYVKALDEHYHSVHGAVQESMHIFIQAGLNQFSQDKIAILEFGFGTGLNAFLTAINAKRNCEIYYHSMEKYPVKKEIVEKLNYGDSFNGIYKNIFQTLHDVPWCEKVKINDMFTLFKEECDFKDAKPSQRFNLIYFDAFAPEVQPKLWTREIFEKAYNALLPGGRLLTYCAKGVVRRTMQEVGFKVERLPGPPGKREILRAKKEVKL